MYNSCQVDSKQDVKTEVNASIAGIQMSKIVFSAQKDYVQLSGRKNRKAINSVK